MRNDELYDRIQALEAFTIDYLKKRRDRTFGQFWADYDAFDVELHSRLQEGEVDDDVRSALNSLADTTDVLSEGRPYPDRRIADGIPPVGGRLADG